jgi:hypothetical protein
VFCKRFETADDNVNTMDDRSACLRAARRDRIQMHWVPVVAEIGEIVLTLPGKEGRTKVGSGHRFRQS